MRSAASDFSVDFFIKYMPKIRRIKNYKIYSRTFNNLEKTKNLKRAVYFSFSCHTEKTYASTNATLLKEYLLLILTVFLRAERSVAKKRRTARFVFFAYFAARPPLRLSVPKMNLGTARKLCLLELGYELVDCGLRVAVEHARVGAEEEPVFKPGESRSLAAF